MEIKRTIETILNLETGKVMDVYDLFHDPIDREAEIFQLRSKIQQQVQQKRPVYVCIYCKQSIGIRGRIHGKDYYLVHTFRSDDCIIKTGHILTEEQIRCIKYNGEKESDLHNQLKNGIAHYLKQDELVISVQNEKVYKNLAISKEWKKPDVLAEMTDKKVAFELQLSTTFLSVIVSRTVFYRNRGVFLIWVFPNFSLDSHLQLFTQKDVYYNNSFNVYVFDEDSKLKSQQENRLFLKCYYKHFRIEGESIKDKWVSTYISLKDLHFDMEKLEVYFYNSLQEKDTLTGILKAQKEAKNAVSKKATCQNKAERALNYLREFYKIDREPIPRSEEFPLDEIETADEIDVFNEKLGFSRSKVGIVANLIETGSKPNFLKFICEQDNILIDTKNMLIRGHSVFEYLVYIKNQWEFYQKIPLIFRKGYILTDKDYSEFHNLYDKNYFNQTEHERNYIERWAFIHCLNSLWHKEDAFKLMEARNILFAILSLKNDMSIGFKFANLKQLTHNILTHNSDFGNIYIKALKQYGQYDKQVLDDKSGKLKRRLDYFFQTSPPQNQRFTKIIHQIFPEL